MGKTRKIEPDQRDVGVLAKQPGFSEPGTAVESPTGFSPEGTVLDHIDDLDEYRGAASVVDNDAARKTPYGEVITPGTKEWDHVVEVHTRDTVPGDGSVRPESILQVHLDRLELEPQNRREIYAVCQIWFQNPLVFKGLESHVLEKFQRFDAEGLAASFRDQIAQVMNGLQQRLPPKAEPKAAVPAPRPAAEPKPPGNELDWALEDLRSDSFGALKRLYLIFQNSTKKHLFAGREADVIAAIRSRDFQKQDEQELAARLTAQLQGKEAPMPQDVKRENERPVAAPISAPRLGGRRTGESAAAQPPIESQTHVMAAAAIASIEGAVPAQALDWNAWKKSAFQTWVDLAFKRYFYDWIDALAELVRATEVPRLIELNEYLYRAVDRPWPGLTVANFGNVRVYLRSDRLRADDGSSSLELSIDFVRAAAADPPLSRKEDQDKLKQLYNWMLDRLDILFGMKRTPAGFSEFFSGINPSFEQVVEEFWGDIWSLFGAACRELTANELVPETEVDTSFWRQVEVLSETLPRGSWVGFPFLRVGELCLYYFRGRLTVIQCDHSLEMSLIADHGADEAEKALHELAASVIMKLPLSVEALQRQISAMNQPDMVEELLNHALESEK
ncbi:MAG: hypothetical protein ACOZBH_01615 [Patescibacteria group bacterium]